MLACRERLSQSGLGGWHLVASFNRRILLVDGGMALSDLGLARRLFPALHGAITVYPRNGIGLSVATHCHLGEYVLAADVRLSRPCRRQHYSPESITDRRGRSVQRTEHAVD